MENSLKFIICVLAFLLIAEPIFAQEKEPISEAQVMMRESMRASQDASATNEEYSNDLSPQQRFEESPKHNVHEYDYKQQIIVGGVVMFCVALAMIASNNYNPKPGSK